MENENSPEPKLLKTTSTDSEESTMFSLDQVIRNGLAKLCALLSYDPNPALISVWNEALQDLSPTVARIAFARLQKTFQPTAACPFPVPAQLRACIATAIKNSDEAKAERAWQYALDLRRKYWNPDMASGFSRDMPVLSDRMNQAIRAAGVFRDFETLEGLHVWAKRTFIESYLRYGELEQDKYLLPGGPVKDAIARLAKSKALPE